jgi:hypothetical protein
MLVRKVQMAAAGKCLIYVLICGTGALMEGPNDAKRTHVRSSTLGAYCLMQLLTLAASSGGGRWSLPHGRFILVKLFGSEESSRAERKKQVDR